MRIKKPLYAFTIAELMVAVALISIIALWISNLNFNRISNKQKIAIETIKVVSLIENIRNYSLTWRWVGVNLDHPDYWELVFNTSGSVKAQYEFSGIQNYETKNILAPFSLSELRCSNLDRSGIDNSPTSLTLRFNGDSISIQNCPTTTVPTGKAKILEADISFDTITKTIRINTLTWIVEIL